jgi:hypothetical protein
MPVLTVQISEKANAFVRLKVPRRYGIGAESVTKRFLCTPI